tara:strand:- start:223 stop:1176 length:954 start_codon:yes stop_codon:yes gene_type:complete
MNFNHYKLALISFVFCISGLKLIIPSLRKYINDVPNERSSHLIAKPTGGGIVFVITSVLGAGLLNYPMLAMCLPIALVGFIDDLKDLSSKFRFSFQIFTVLVILFSSKFFNHFVNLDIPLYSIGLIFILLYVFCSCGVINFINFMDGIDGLVSGCIAIFFIIASFKVNSAFLPLALSLIAFLFFNWEPSKVFMGDVGSTFLGAAVVLTFLESRNFMEFIALLMIISPLILDCSICLFARFIRGHNIFKPHKLHLYQRLNQGGWSHSKVSSLYILLTALLSLAYLVLGSQYIYIFILFELLLGIYLNKKYAIPFDSNY